MKWCKNPGDASHEVSTATVLSRCAENENVPRQGDVTADGAAECIVLTNPNVSTDRLHRHGARPITQIKGQRSLMTLTPVNADVVRLRNHRYHNSTIARSANYSSARSLGGTLGGTPQPLRLQDRFERLRDLEEELPREETESRKRSNHNTRKVGPYKKQLLTHNPHSC